MPSSFVMFKAHRGAFEILSEPQTIVRGLPARSVRKISNLFFIYFQASLHQTNKHTSEQTRTFFLWAKDCTNTTMHIPAPRVIPLLTLLEWCSTLCSANSWAEYRSLGHWDQWLTRVFVSIVFKAFPMPVHFNTSHSHIHTS
jgi:hypothetical protein